MKHAFPGCGAGTGPRMALVLGFALVLSTPPARAEGPAHRAGEVVIESGTVMTPEGAPVAYELGTLFVPANRTSPGSRLIGVGFARMKAARPTGAPPVFVLPGGPGRGYLSSLGVSADREHLLRTDPGTEFLQQPEVLKQVLAFLKTGDTRGLPLQVSLPVPTFRRPSFAAPVTRGATRE